MDRFGLIGYSLDNNTSPKVNGSAIKIVSPLRLKQASGYMGAVMNK